MVCSADELVLWRDFPKGLRILLLDEDNDSAAETRFKLEAMDYTVSIFSSEKDARDAILRNAECFHIAIIEVTAANSHGSFRFLEMAKDLPTIVISNVCCLSTMMKCIALGAAEFLQKPLSEDKLRNIWQHVVHKAFNAGGDVLSKSLEPIKETVVSMIQFQSNTSELKIENNSKAENMKKNHDGQHTIMDETDRFPAPSTPQLVNCLPDKESTENANDLIEMRECSQSDSKFVDFTTNNLSSALNHNKEVSSCRPTEVEAEEEINSCNGSKTNECCTRKEASQPPPLIHIGDNVESSVEDQEKKKSFLSNNSHSHGNRSSRKKNKVDWTPELHRQFVQAVEQLGIDQAIPSKILELMKVKGLTRHNIASHLQKHRMHRRHILPKEDGRRWKSHRETVPLGYMQKPLVVFPPYHSNCGLQPSQVYPFWGHPSYHPLGNQMWGHTSFPTWHPTQGSWPWQTQPAIHADAWGYPFVPPYNQHSIPSQSPSNGFDSTKFSSEPLDFCPEEVIDEVVKEAMSKPWLPLPLGLRPPSTDSVLAELHRRGIRSIPPHSSVVQQ